jgi:glutamate/tyrosine decarboxylase-like PLP-dependent enzyme
MFRLHDVIDPSTYAGLGEQSSFLQLLEEVHGTLAALPGLHEPRLRVAEDQPLFGDPPPDRYARIPELPHASAGALVAEIVLHYLQGAVNWRSAECFYNVGAPVARAAAAAYAVGIDANVYLINDGLAGNVTMAEKSVITAMAALAGLDERRHAGLFTFGGTGTNLYAMKVGLRKADPASAERGSCARHCVLITDDAHFSHVSAADWLGIGTNNLRVVDCDAQRRSSVDHAERLMEEAAADGLRSACIIVNGGTTYDHTIDDIAAFADMRDRHARRHRLAFKPHLHVDSVIGWAWLVFRGYDFAANPLHIGERALGMLREQTARVAQMPLADSWGVDFHKGIGGCPVDTSLFMLNSSTDLQRLGRSGLAQGQIHQLAPDFSRMSPADYTLETSRSGGKALAALAALHAIGIRGYQARLAQLIELTVEFRDLVCREKDMWVLNLHALGFQTMVRLHPPELCDAAGSVSALRAADRDDAHTVAAINEYMKRFFVWDNGTRMDLGLGGPLYSFSKKYVTTPSGVDQSGLKFYFVSPNSDSPSVRASVAHLARRKKEFDRTVWGGAATPRRHAQAAGGGS